MLIVIATTTLNLNNNKLKEYMMSPENNQNENKEKAEPIEPVEILDDEKVEVKEVEEVEEVEKVKTETDPEIDTEKSTEKENADFETDDNNISDQDNELNLWEKFLAFEGTTKVGMLCSIILLFGVLFANWLDYNWWIVLILTGVSIRNLYKQKIDLEDENPFEARMAGAFLYGVVGLMVLRDLLITIKLDRISEVAEIANIEKITTFF